VILPDELPENFVKRVAWFPNRAFKNRQFGNRRTQISKMKETGIWLKKIIHTLHKNVKKHWKLSKNKK
jgi:hypothetical protein